MAKRKATPRRLTRSQRKRGSRVFIRKRPLKRKANIPRFNTWSNKKFRSINRFASIADFWKASWDFQWTSALPSEYDTNKFTDNKKHLFYSMKLLDIPDVGTLASQQSRAPDASIYAKYLNLKLLVSNQSREKIYLRIVCAWDKYFGFPTKQTLNKIVLASYGTENLPLTADFFPLPYQDPTTFSSALFNTIHYKKLNKMRYTTVYDKVFPLTGNLVAENRSNYVGFGSHMKSLSKNIPINRHLYYSGLNDAGNTESPTNCKLIMFCFMGTADPDILWQPIVATVNGDVITTQQKVNVNVQAQLNYITQKTTVKTTKNSDAMTAVRLLLPTQDQPEV